MPDGVRVQHLVERAHSQFAAVREGEVSNVYPALARVDADLFGLCVAGISGNLFHAGDWTCEFTIMSISKPFVFALVCASTGVDAVRGKIGVNATGLPFNSLTAVEAHPRGLTNPMVNPGAIATTSLIPGNNPTEKWEHLRGGLSRFAGRDLDLDSEILASATASNFRNREIVDLLQTRGAIYCDPMEALDLYTRQCSLRVTARDLAVMAATLANGGRNPVTKDQVLEPAICHHVLAVMTTAGLYEGSGDWLYEVGLPGKSGISGGIITVSPGKGGLSTFAPRLDGNGNSVKGRLAARLLSTELGMDLFVSMPGE